MEEVGLPDDCTKIKNVTVHQRVSRGQLNDIEWEQGQSLPMHSIEPYLVLMCVKMEAAGVPLESKSVLALANDLISGTETEKKVIKFKQVNSYFAANMTTAQLGPKYYYSFMGRCAHLIKAKHAAKSFDVNCKQWSNFVNFEYVSRTLYRDGSSWHCY